MREPQPGEPDAGEDDECRCREGHAAGHAQGPPPRRERTALAGGEREAAATGTLLPRAEGAHDRGHVGVGLDPVVAGDLRPDRPQADVIDARGNVGDHLRRRQQALTHARGGRHAVDQAEGPAPREHGVEQRADTHDVIAAGSVLRPQRSVDGEPADAHDVGVAEQREGIVEVRGLGDEQGSRSQPAVVHVEFVTVLQGDGHLPDHRHGLVDLDRLAFALLVDVGERASLHPLAHDHEVRRASLNGLGGAVGDDRLGRQDVQHGDDAAIVDRRGSAGRGLCGARASVVGGDESERDGALERRIESLPQLDDAGLGDQDVEEVAADPLVAHPSRVRVSVASSPDERPRRRSTLRCTSATTSPTSWIRMAHAAAR